MTDLEFIPHQARLPTYQTRRIIELISEDSRLNPISGSKEVLTNDSSRWPEPLYKDHLV